MHCYRGKGRKNTRYGFKSKQKRGERSSEKTWIGEGERKREPNVGTRREGEKKRNL